MNSMKTVGIIGGLGPETTANFYLEVVFSFFEKNKETRPPMLLWNVPIPNKVEEEFITSTKGGEVYVPLLVDAAKRLEKGGADFIVIPCNSVHMFIDNVRKAVKIPVLSIIEETVAFLNEQKVKEVGILATSVTLRKKLYEHAFSKSGIRSQAPSDENQAKMGRIIRNLVASRYTEEDRVQLLFIIEQFIAQGVQTVILACTDLQMLAPEHEQVRIYDTMKILADSTISELLKEKK